MATGSSVEAPPDPVPGAGFLRRALPFAYQGVFVAAAVIALPPAGADYESEAVLEVEAAPAQAGAVSPAESVEAYLLELVAASGGDEALLGCSEAPPRSSVLRVGDRSWRVSCRGEQAQVAERRCESIVKQTSAHFQAFEIAGRTKNAARSLSSRLLALGLGLGLGLAWVWLRVELRARKSSRQSSLPPGRISSPPLQPTRIELETLRTDVRPRHATPQAQQPSASSTSSVRPKQALDRTMLGTGPSPAPPVIDTTAEPSRAPQSARPNRDPMLAPYESTSRWAPDPAISASSTRGELRALCDQLSVLAANSCFVLRVSSDAESASSKSHIAAQLAWTLADAGQARVLLVEADFDDPNVHRVMRLETPSFKGFSQQLYRRLTGGERVPWSVARCAPCLSVLPEGRIRTPGLVHTAQFSSALSELRRYYDILVVDGPAADTTADTRALDGIADGVVFAVTAGPLASEGLKTASELFGDRPLLWIVHTHPAERVEQSSHG